MLVVRESAGEGESVLVYLDPVRLPWRREGPSEEDGVVVWVAEGRLVGEEGEFLF